jgi:hypothetical protein
MQRPSKKDIAARVAELKGKKETSSSSLETNAAKLTAKQSSLRIRKQGI